MWDEGLIVKHYKTHRVSVFFREDLHRRGFSCRQGWSTTILNNFYVFKHFKFSSFNEGKRPVFEVETL